MRVHVQVVNRAVCVSLMAAASVRAFTVMNPSLPRSQPFVTQQSSVRKAVGVPRHAQTQTAVRWPKTQSSHKDMVASYKSSELEASEQTAVGVSSSQNAVLAAFADWRQPNNVNEVINVAVLVGICLFGLWKLTSVDAAISRGWDFEETLLRIPQDAWASYSAVLEQHPIGTKAVTSASVYTIGDIISQQTDGVDIADLDRPRILRSLLAGLIAHGPMSHVWYGACDGLFENVLHWTAWWSFFPKVIVDQATWGPFWNNTYILLLGLMKMESWTSIWGDMKRTTVPLVISGLKLWPLAHLVTYGLVPVENRLLWVDLVEILWVTILATQAAEAAGGKQTGDDVGECVAASMDAKR